MNTVEEKIGNYLTALRRSLGRVAAADCDEIVSEIGVHLRDSIELPGSDIEPAILRLGPPEELAKQYSDSLLIEGTAHTISPWLIMRAVWRLAKTGALGFFLFLLASVGYGAGAAMVVSALLKLILPEQVGLWIGPGVFNFGFHGTGASGGEIGFFLPASAPAREVLGWWYIPAALGIGSFCISGTTRLLRRLIKKARSGRPKAFLLARSAMPVS
ncbi:MAG: hypothetical protein M3Y72_04025 [Acidobacteriota bacterium]|nr:hypothetical protein [Acidobacteriota bacterium]